MKRSDNAGLKTALARAVMYDTVIQHGDGDDPDSFYALIKRTNKKAGGSPKDGIDEKKWLNKFLDVRYDDLMNPANHDTRDEWRESVACVDVLRSIAKEYGIRSERQLEKEIYYNMAYRWFLGLNINDPVPHHSTISWNRRTRFKDTPTFQDIFDEIVLQAINHDMVGGRVLFTDSTHLKANANKHKYTRKTIEQDTQNYIKELDEAVQEDREVHGKKLLKEKEEVKTEKDICQSTTDPESGYLYRENKPEGFFYLDHRTTEMKYNNITDAHVTPGNVHDSVPYLDRLDHQIARFGFQVEAVALDSGYLTTPICKGSSDRRIFGVIAHRRFFQQEDYLRNGNFSTILNVIITYVQVVRSFYIRQLIEKVIGSTNQIRKNVHRVLSLKAAQGRRIIKK